MDKKNRLELNTKKIVRIIGAVISFLLIVFEVIICVQFVSRDSNPQAWELFIIVSFSLVLDVLCLVDLYLIKNMVARIVVYSFDFFILLVICTLTGSSYISALYCVILSELYINVEDIKTKVIVFASSCIMFVVTIVVGWFLQHLRGASYNEILAIISGAVTGLIIMAVHFLVTNFLVAYYRNNARLTQALKEADASKAELREAYDKLAETATVEERNRIARDIHDNAGHSMTAVIMQTEAAKLLIDTSPEEAKAKIISANIQAKNALEQMRDSVHLLAGRHEASTMKEELEEIIAQTMDGTDVKIRSSLGDCQLTGDRRRFICNSLKELLANGIRHGGATAFYVEYDENEDSVHLTVSDNGAGLPENFKEGFGLKGIREKAVAFGGTIIYESEQGDGCEIRISIGLSNKEK